MTYSVYWVHLVDHDLAEGYIGITHNFHRRMLQHKRRPSGLHFKNAINKYGWDELIKEVIYTGLSRDEAENIELFLRPDKDIGWNTNIGGLAVPTYKDFKSSKSTCDKISKSKAGTLNPANKLEPNQVIEIFELTKTNLSSLDISKIFHISDTTVAKIKYLKKQYYKEVISEYLRSKYE